MPAKHDAAARTFGEERRSASGNSRGRLRLVWQRPDDEGDWQSIGKAALALTERLDHQRGSCGPAGDGGGNGTEGNELAAAILEEVNSRRHCAEPYGGRAAQSDRVGEDGRPMGIQK